MASMDAPPAEGSPARDGDPRGLASQLGARQIGARQALDDRMPADLSSADFETSEFDFYSMFCSTVTLRQLTQWLPDHPLSVLDVSYPLADAEPGDDRIRDVLLSAGHQVTSVWQEYDTALTHRPSPSLVVGDLARLDWLREESVDAVVAEAGALSHCLATEDALLGIARVLRPGGRLLASVDSMVSGLSALAEQHRWPELADAPAADVVLVPSLDRPGEYTRCFSPEDIRECFVQAGLEVEWIRPRTMLPAATVRHTLLADPSALGELVISELTLETAHEDEAHGARLVVSGRKPL
jgi:SAM-dependent methyltransferase